MCVRTIKTYTCSHSEETTTRCGCSSQWTSLIPKQCRSALALPVERKVEGDCTMCGLGKANDRREERRKAVRESDRQEEKRKEAKEKGMKERDKKAEESEVKEDVAVVKESPKNANFDEADAGVANDKDVKYQGMLKRDNEASQHSDAVQVEQLLQKMTEAANSDKNPAEKSPNNVSSKADATALPIIYGNHTVEADAIAAGRRAAKQDGPFTLQSAEFFQRKMRRAQEKAAKDILSKMDGSPLAEID